MKVLHSLIPALAASLLTSANAQSFNVDVTNAVDNPQVEIPTGYFKYASHDNPGPGFSVGSFPTDPTPSYGTYYIADGFLTGYTTEGLWTSAWLDAIYPAHDYDQHGGMGTIDVLAPGGINGYVGATPVIYGNGLPALPVGSLDTNGQYLAIGAAPVPPAGQTPGSEYALWDTSFTVATTTTFQFDYYWAAAGGTLADGTEILDLPRQPGGRRRHGS